jgi:choline dehydrogenase-like flavoprotein
MKKSQVPVLVVGAGAAGTMLTLELARRGVNVRTIDRLPKPGDTSKAITVHARMLEILERIDRRLADRFLERGIHNKGYVLHFVDGAGRRSEVRPGSHRPVRVRSHRRFPRKRSARTLVLHRSERSSRPMNFWSSCSAQIGVSSNPPITRSGQPYDSRCFAPNALFIRLSVLRRRSPRHPLRRERSSYRE